MNKNNVITNSRKTTTTLSMTPTPTTTGAKGFVVAKSQALDRNYNNSDTHATSRKRMMWIDKYAPQTAQELCVAPKKVEQVRSFLSSYIEYTLESVRRQQQQHHHHHHQQQKWQNSYSQQESSSGGGYHDCSSMMSNNNNNKNTIIINNNPPQPPETKLMILIGNPGVGKSAMVRTLAREMNIQILSWNDDNNNYNNNNMRQRSGDGFGSGSGYYYDTLQLPYQSQLNSFDEFLSMSGVLGMHSLDIVGGDDDDDVDDVTAVASSSSSSSSRERKNNNHGWLSQPQQPRQQHTMSTTDGHRRRDFVASLILVEEVRFFVCRL